MSTATQRNVKLNPNNSHVTPSRVRPSLVGPVSDSSFSLEQELEPFGTWVSEPLMVCDPAFVAEMPRSNGMVLKIGHFDEVGGVTHIEI